MVPTTPFFINRCNLSIEMTTHFTNKFNTHLPTIREAIEGEIDLRSNRKLYKKIHKYYKDLGVNFTGDTNYDYDTLLDYIYEDLF